MVNTILLYIGSIILLLWGVAHLAATKGVVKGFGKITLDNRRIITMEWIMEGVAFLFISVLVVLVTLFSISNIVYLISAGGLIVMAAVSAFTGARIRFLPYRLCPFVLTTVAILYILGSVL
jgi:hypothetical protein